MITYISEYILYISNGLEAVAHESLAGARDLLSVARQVHVQ